MVYVLLRISLIILVAVDVLSKLKKKVCDEFYQLLCKVRKGYKPDYEIILEEISYINLGGSKDGAYTIVVNNSCTNKTPIVDGGSNSPTVSAKYTIKKITDGLADNIREAYKLVQTIEGESIEVGAQISIYKDQTLKSAKLVNNDGTKNGQFLMFTYALSDGSESNVYIDVSDFQSGAIQWIDV